MNDERIWPGIQERRDAIIENDDPAVWRLTSASYDALGAPTDPETGRELHEGCEVSLDVEEMGRAGFRVVLEAPLTEEEERCAIGETWWPLLSVPCGILLIGECARGRTWLETDAEGRDVWHVSWHDRAAIVPVPPGNYRVRVVQYLNGHAGNVPTQGPAFLFQLKKIDREANEIRIPKVRKLTIPEHVPAHLRSALRSSEGLRRRGMIHPVIVLDGCQPSSKHLPKWIEPLTDCTDPRGPMPDYVQPI